ncbi:MAG: type I methionyl aminopeptidase [Pseudomonadota bacterium]
MNLDTEAAAQVEAQIPINGPAAFEKMRAAGQLAARALDMLVPHVEPGVTTARLDDLIFEFAMDHGAMPATLHYKGFRHSSCISINHVVCHGIPGPKRLRDGDILNIDVTLIVDGWHGDTSRMYTAGTPSRKAERLIDITHQALMVGIAAVQPGNTTNDIGRAIQDFARSERCGVVTDFCGHGLGESFHLPPNILHYVPQPKPGEADHIPTELKPGMFFTIEPMINLGKPDVKVLRDGWTAVTRDRSLSAQFEHTIGVTEDGYEVFTFSPGGFEKPPYHGASPPA